MSNQLIYCTISYPFESRHYWKEIEIIELAKSYDKVLVVPFCSSYTNLKSYRNFPKNVKIYRPILNSDTGKSKYCRCLFWILFGKRRKIYRNDFLRNKVYKSLETLKSWFVFSAYQEIGLQSKTYSELTTVLDSQTDILYYWGRNNFFIPLVRSKSWRRSILRLHGADIYHERHKNHYLPFREELYGKMDYILNISEHGKNYINNRFGAEIGQKCLVHYLGGLRIGKSTFRGDRQRLKIVSCSYVSEVKRVHLIIEILTYLNIEVDWVHIGRAANDSSENLMSKLKEVAHAKLDSSNVNYDFLENYKMKEVPNYLAENHVDLFINVSYSEGLPVSIMEAFGAGIPVIAPDIGGISEVVISNYNGYLIDRDFNPAEVASIIEKFSNLAEDDVECMRQNAFAIFDDKLDIYKNTNRLSKLLVKTS